MVDNNKVLEVLRTVNDPNSGNDLISMKLIDKLVARDNVISFTVNANGMPDVAKFQLHETLSHKLQDVYPDAKINIHFGNAGTTVRPLSQVKNIIAVASGKGGVGKSTVSTNLALGLKALGANVGLMDADLYGPSIPTMLNIKNEKPKIEQLYGKHRIRPIEKYGIHTISIGNIVEPEQAVVLRGPRLGGIIKQFVNDVIWPDLDYLIIDLPPGTGDIQLTLVQTVPVTAAIIVTTPQDVAIADAIKAMNMFRLENINVPIVGVVENMSWFTPKDMPDKKYYIFGQGGGKVMAKKSQSALLAQLPLITDIRTAGDNGIPIVLDEQHEAQSYYLQMAQKAAQQIAVRNELRPATQIVGVNVQNS